MTADAVGGVWQYSLNLARALHERGVEATLAVMGPAPGPPQLAHAADAGIAVVHGDYRLEWMSDAWADVVRAGQWLLDLHRSIAPDVVHLNGYAHATLPWQSPALVVAHSCVRTWWKAVRGEKAPATVQQYTQEVTAGLAAARLVVAPTRAMLNALRREYGVPSCGWVIPNGTPLASRIDERLHARKEPLIFAAGRAWDDAKNLEALCAVAEWLHWPVYVAGSNASPDGGHRDLPFIRHLGSIASSEMLDWYRRASIYVLPARYEPFGLSVLEAACAGCALVLGDIPSLRENWDGAAVFVRPDDREALASALQALIVDAVDREALGREAQRRAAAFTMDRMADGYMRAYHMLTT
jgi:glycosyltransferase involved in cell wall biosynthesis